MAPQHGGGCHRDPAGGQQHPQHAPGDHATCAAPGERVWEGDARHGLARLTKWVEGTGSLGHAREDGAVVAGSADAPGRMPCILEAAPPW